MPQLDDLFVLQRPSSGSHHKFSWGDLLIDANNSVASEYGVHVGETPPPDPHEGDLWYQPSTEEFKIYLVDLTAGSVNGVEIRNGGSGYSVAQNLPTTSGSGHELFIDVTATDGSGKITGIAVSQNGTGHGYAVDDVVFLFNNGHGNGSVLVKSVTSLANGTWTVINDVDLPTIGNGALTIKLHGQAGANQTGTFTANQENGTTITLPQIDYTQLTNTPTIGNAAINVNAGNGLSATGTQATANQETATTRTLTAVPDPGKGIEVTATGIGLGGSWANIPSLDTAP